VDEYKLLPTAFCWSLPLKQGLTLVHFSAQPEQFLNPVSAFGTAGSEGPHMIGREDTGTLSTNHMRAFRPYGSESGDWV